jgi:hypothetical protein
MTRSRGLASQKLGTADPEEHLMQYKNTVSKHKQRM